MNIQYSKGMTNRVSTVENPRPQTIEAATGPHSNDLPPSPTASENRPPMVVTEVIRIGTTRRRAAYTAACSTPMPEASRSLAASISTMAEFTAMPVSAMTP